MWKSPGVTRADMGSSDVVFGEIEFKQVVDVLEEEHIYIPQHNALDIELH